MICEILPVKCAKGEIFPAAINGRQAGDNFVGHIIIPQAQISAPKLGLRAGNFLCHKNINLFVVDGFAFIPQNFLNKPVSQGDNSPGSKNYLCPLLKALQDIEPADSYETLSVKKEGWSLAVVILSDKGYLGAREDTSGPLIMEIMETSLNISYKKYYIIPDDIFILKGLLSHLAWLDEMDLIVTSGGTGLGIRDITPQVTEQILDYQLPGMEQAMMAYSLKKTYNAVLSRAKAGVAGNSLVINLPGSPKAVKENLEAILPALDHGLLKLDGDTRDCGALNGQENK